MQIIFLGTGPSEPVKKNGRTRSSVYVSSDRGSYHFVIDCTPDFLEQVNRENVENIDFILISHGHSDARGGLGDPLKAWMDKKDIEKMPVYLEKQTWEKIKAHLKDTSHIEPKFFSSNEPFSPSETNDLLIRPFRILHSLQPGFPMVGFRFKKIVYSEDVGEIPPESVNFYKDAAIIIFDAAMWFDKHIKGHQNVEDALNYAKKFCPSKFILIQAGHTYPKQDEAEKEIDKYWKKMHEDCKSDVVLSYDGLKLSTQELVTETLTESREGIYLARPHGHLIYEGKKSLIVKSKFFKSEIGKILYLIEDSLCYGVIKLKIPDKIGLKEFDELREKHQITEEERKKWWPNKEILYSYGFDVIRMFDTPRKVEVPQGIQTFVKDFKFLIDQEMIQDIENYFPKKIDTDVLKDDWRIVIAWFSRIRSEKPFKFTREQVIDLGKKIYDELLSRGINFHPDTMTPAGNEFYEIVSGEKKNSEKAETDFRDPKIWNSFKDIVIIKNFASIVGSSVKSHDGHKPNDLDIQFRMRDPPDFIRRAVEVRMCKEFDEWNKLHFVWGDPEGPHDSFVPLYDLKLERIRPLKKVEMQEVELAEKVATMKPKKRFYNVDDAIKYMFETGHKFAIEKKYNGFRGVLVKNGESVRIFSDQGRDISAHFKTIIEEAQKLSNKDLAIDSEIVYKEGGRSEIAKYITGKSDLPDNMIALHVFDIMNFGEPILKKEWYERKQILHSLNFTPHIKEVSSIIVSNPEQAAKAINLVRNLKGSEGAMIKRYESTDSVYSPGKDSDAWIKFRNEDPLDVVVTEVIKKENGYSYRVGVAAESPENLEPKYVMDGPGGKVLDLGHTFVTSQKFEVGDHIQLLIEEVWRHEYPDGKIRYSIHKPNVMKKISGPTSSLKYLDNLAVSKGESVVEHSEGGTTTSTPGIPSVQGGYVIKKKIIRPDNKYSYENIETDPANASDETLIRDWEDLDRFYQNKKDGIDVGMSIEDIINSASLVYKEIIKRKLEYKFEVTDLYKIVSSGETGLSEELAQDEEGGTRSAAAASYWKDNWWKAYPPSGKGKFIYHHHWRGLTEEDSKRTNEDLLENTDHSIHGDIRFEGRNNNLFGFTTFLGTAADNRRLKEKDKLFHMSDNKGSSDNIQGTWKLPQPESWIDVGKKAPVISKPEGVGATSNKFAKFFGMDDGTYEMGVWREHFFEVFMHGKHINGRMLIQYAPMGGQRVWIIDMPEDQKPYADTHDIEEVKAELKKKGQKHLVWGKPGQKPELITI
jgi:phosphoribosyl 1,2-cyclic phosphate phosphodiesterase